jgi:hypothetical protein
LRSFCTADSASRYLEKIVDNDEEYIDIIESNSAWLVWDKYCKSIIDWNGFFSHYQILLKQLFDININTNLIPQAKIFLLSNAMNDMVGVHIRSTDFLRHYAITYPDRKLATVEDFIFKLSEIKSNRVFLATDSIDIRLEFIEKFKGDIYHLDHSYKSENFRQTSVESALSDIYVLSRCSKLIATHGSSFSGLAGDISNLDVLYI